jgi:hypothetical protein
MPKGKNPPQTQCIYQAPFFAWNTGENSTTYHLKQANCHHWDCPKCGVGRAKEEYWRIVKGSEMLTHEGYKLWFITITTRGGDMTVATAEGNYLEWTNRFLTRIRADAKRQSLAWFYVQVTERQKRKHPHSHILITYRPDDIFDSTGELVIGVAEKWAKNNQGVREAQYVDAIRSDYLQDCVCKSGLGEQYDISEVRDSSAVARYVGKYLFKHSLLTVWPKGWKRVRYSQSWPESSLPIGSAMVLMNERDWYQLASCADKVITNEQYTAQIAANHLQQYPTKVILKENSKS